MRSAGHKTDFRVVGSNGYWLAYHTSIVYLPFGPHTVKHFVSIGRWRDYATRAAKGRTPFEVLYRLKRLMELANA